MSTILKALRRLEKEREVEAPGLRDQVLADAPPRDARPRFPLLVGAGAIGAIFVVAGFTFLDGRFDSKQGAAAVVAPEARTAPEPSTTPTEIVLPAPKFQEPSRATPPPRPRREAAPPRATQPSQPVEPPVVPAASRRAVSAPSPAASRRAASAPSAVAPRAAAKPIETSTPTPIPAPASVAAPPPTPEATPDPTVVEAVEKIAGIMGQPEVARRAPLPSMVVQRTLWHPRSERRLAFLTVEGRTGVVELREGDAVGDAVVKQIDPSAVIFLHRGVEIRRRIGAGD